MKTKNRNIKKCIIALIFLLIALISTIHIDLIANADTNNEIQLGSIVQDIVSGVDLSEIENMVEELDDIQILDESISQKLGKILKGEFFTNYSKVSTAIISLIFGDIRRVIPFILTIISVGILCNLIYGLKSDNKNTGEVINFVFLSVVTIIILVAFKNILSTVSHTFSLITKQMQIFFPILITLLTSIGSFSSVSIYNPLVAVLTSTVSFIFEKFLYPIFIVIFVFTIVGSLSSTIKLDKLQNFLMSTFKWTIGIVFTLFTGFLSIQGITAGKFDSISIKATKFAVKSYIPIIGSYVSEGMDFIVLGSILVKNAVGLIGVLILFMTILSPIILIIIYKLAISLSAGILQLTGNNKFSSFLSLCSKVLVLPIVLLIGVAFMYVITLCLIICTANIF